MSEANLTYSPYTPTVGSGRDLERAMIALSKTTRSGPWSRCHVWCRRMILSSKEPVDIFADVRGEADELRRCLWNLIEETPNLDWVLETSESVENVAKLMPSLWFPGVACASNGKWPENVRVVLGRSFSGEEFLEEMLK